MPGLQLESSNAIEFLRVSTDHQDLLRQVADMAKLARRFPGLKTVRELRLKGVSGTAVLENVEVQQLLKDLAAPNIHGIKVSALDRLMRPKKYDTVGMFQRFVDLGKVIWSQKEGFVDPATDEGFEICMNAATRAGAEWRTLKQRTMDGRLEHLDAGLLDHGKAAYGYRYIKKWEKDGRRFVIDESEALTTPDSPMKGIRKWEVVRDIYEWRRANMPTNAITTKLNVMGILSQEGKSWGRRSVLQILRNPTYKGEHRRMGRTFPVDPITNAETWETVQRINAASKEAHNGRPSKGKYLLRSMLWCGSVKCGHRMVSQPGRETRKASYRCGNVQQNPFVKLCHAPSAPCAKIEAVAWAAIWRLLKDPKRLLAMGVAYYDAFEKPNAGRKALQQELAAIPGEVEELQYMLRKRLMDRTKATAEIETLQRREREIRQELAAAGQVVNLPPLQQAEAGLRRITEGKEPSTFERRRDILEGILDLRMTYYDGQLVIEGKIPIGAEKKCLRRQDHIDTSFTPIPFELKERVA
jgi:DNA invertase Pin-like site-specific DNA recombinase